jgi:hypothetical protein
LSLGIRRWVAAGRRRLLHEAPVVRPLEAAPEFLGAGEISRIMVFMTKIEAIEKEIQQLSEEDLSLFRKWFAEFDFALWDRQIERDSRAGKLDALINEARRDHGAGKTKKL